MTATNPSPPVPDAAETAADAPLFRSPAASGSGDGRGTQSPGAPGPEAAEVPPASDETAMQRLRHPFSVAGNEGAARP